MESTIGKYSRHRVGVGGQRFFYSLKQIYLVFNSLTPYDECDQNDSAVDFYCSEVKVPQIAFLEDLDIHVVSKCSSSYF